MCEKSSQLAAIRRSRVYNRACLSSDQARHFLQEVCFEALAPDDALSPIEDLRQAVLYGLKISQTVSKMEKYEW